VKGNSITVLYNDKQSQKSNETTWPTDRITAPLACYITLGLNWIMVMNGHFSLQMTYTTLPWIMIITWWDSCLLKTSTA